MRPPGLKHNSCHPERSEHSAKRDTRGVEGPLTPYTLSSRIKAFCPGLLLFISFCQDCHPEGSGGLAGCPHFPRSLARSRPRTNAAEFYGDSAIVVGIFRTKGVDKGKKYMNRERFVDTWVKIKGMWKCVAAVTVLIPAKQSPD